MELSAALTAQMALTRNNAVMGMMKSSANADRAIANMLTEAIENVPTGRRGGLVDITA